MTIQEIQTLIHDLTSIKVGARKLSGSMKAFISFRPKKTKGNYPNFTPADLDRIKEKLSENNHFGYYSFFSIEISNTFITPFPCKTTP